MKKILFFTCLFISITAISFAQCFDKGTKFINAGFGLGIQYYRFTDVTNDIVGTRDTSAAIEIPFGFEYGVLNFLGISVNGNFARYLTGDNAAGESVKSFDLIPTVNFHAPFGWNKIDLSANIGYGFSRFSYEINSAPGGKAKADGSVFNFGANLRLLFRIDGHLGMNLWYTHSSYNYKKGVITDNNGNKADFRLDGPGNNFGIGFFFRIAAD